MDHGNRVGTSQKIMFYILQKRLFDILVSLIALILLSPLMVIIAVFVKLNSNGPILYKGVRTGKNGKKFKILKFRSMIQDAEQKGGFSTALNDVRFTSVGRLLRKYKLDELPQFFNVLFGEMSLVGPRPQVSFYTDQYLGDELLILTVKPGITDLATLYFNDMDEVLGTVNVDEYYSKVIEPIKNKARIRYVKEKSIILDLRILIETAFLIFGVKNVTGLSIPDLSPERFNE